MNVLVIEDHPGQLKLTQHVLTAAGHHVAAFDSGEEALRAIKEDRPQIVLVDLGLPGMDGLTLVRLLKADPETRDVHVVAVTAFPERFSRNEALTAGCDGYLVKPISTRTLPQELSDLVKNRDP